jgi:hypothetical protein
MRISRRELLIAGVGVVAGACAGQGARSGAGLTPLYARPDRGEWPEQFHQLPEETRAMYRYAVANKAVLQWMPCFCGCVNGGHASNFDCYVSAVLPDGRVQLDTMSFG